MHTYAPLCTASHITLYICVLCMDVLVCLLTFQLGSISSTVVCCEAQEGGKMMLTITKILLVEIMYSPCPSCKSDFCSESPLWAW